MGWIVGAEGMVGLSGFSEDALQLEFPPPRVNMCVRHYFFFFVCALQPRFSAVLYIEHGRAASVGRQMVTVDGVKYIIRVTWTGHNNT